MSFSHGSKKDQHLPHEEDNEDEDGSLVEIRVHTALVMTNDHHQSSSQNNQKVQQTVEDGRKNIPRSIIRRWGWSIGGWRSCGRRCNICRGRLDSDIRLVALMIFQPTEIQVENVKLC